MLGTTAIAVLAWQRGEAVNALWMVVAAACVFAVAYRFHSAWLMANVLTLDELRATPAVVHEDGKDFVQTNRWVVFGHHFAAIAGPGPLVGPVLAAQFGYLPGMLWMLIGATIGGAVHDSVILFCSVRRRGKSLGQMMAEEVGPWAGVVALVSIIAIMIILLAVLALVVVKALAESPWGLFTIAATMPIAVVMGLAMRGSGGHSGRLGWISAFGVVALLAAVYAGKFIAGSSLEGVLTLHGTTLAWVGEGEAGRGAFARETVIHDCDGLLSGAPGLGLVVSYADCVPVVIVARGADGPELAAVHAGWRGMLAGIVGQAAAALSRRGRLLGAVVGPSIGPCCFTVDEGLRARFDERFPGCADEAGVNLWACAGRDLAAAGVPPAAVTVAALCTASDARFFSHRRDHGSTGRHLAIAWRQEA